MTNIAVYDDTANKLEEAADRNNTTVAEIIDLLMEYLEDIE